MILVDCPVCARSSQFSPANTWRPFCSERCRSIDLGAWASERFRIPASGEAADADAQSQTDTDLTLPRG